MTSSLRTTILLVALLAMLMISITPSFSQEPDKTPKDKPKPKPKKKLDQKMPEKEAAGTDLEEKPKKGPENDLGKDPDRKRMMRGGKYVKDTEKEMERDLKIRPKYKHKRGDKKSGEKPCKGESVQLKTVCNSTARYKECVKILKSDRRTSMADYTGLATIALDLAFAKAKEIVGTLDSLAKNTNDTRLQKRLGSCGKYYKTTFASLESAKKHLRQRDYQRAEDEALDALEKSGACEGHFIVGEPEEPKILLKKSKEFEFRIALCPVAIEWLLAKRK